MPTNASPSIARWIESTLTTERLDAQSTIITVFGDSIAPFGGHAWLKSLMQLVEPFGLNERLVRTSVYRLAAEGWLVSHRQGRRAEYRLTGEGFGRFEQAHRRIYNTAEATHWDGTWTLVMLPGSEAPAARAQLRRELGWEGFVPMGPGVLGHPSARLDAVAAIIDRAGLREQVFALRAAETVPHAGRGLQAFAREAWNVGELAHEYTLFRGRFEPLRRALAHAPDPSPREAFVARTLLIHAFRRVQLRDPQLPAALLPPDWPGAAAYALSADIYQRLYDAANRHVLAALEAESGFVPPLTPYFYQRFGGLLNALA